MIGNVLTALLLMGVAFACWCRNAKMTPGHARPEVQGYFFHLSLGSAASAFLHTMAVMEAWLQPWAALPFVGALLFEMWRNRDRWHRPPADVESKA